MKNYRVILVAFLIGITAFSAFRYVASLKEKLDLMSALNQTKEQIAVLESEKQNLLQELEKEKQLQQQLNEENTGLKESLKVNEEKIDKINADFAQAQTTLEQLNSQLAALRQEKDNLNAQVTQVTQEKDNLQARLSSIVELKKAIRELKRQVRQVSVEIGEKVKLEKIIEGNRGFLIKDGKSAYYPARVKIEVVPER